VVVAVLVVMVVAADADVVTVVDVAEIVVCGSETVIIRCPLFP
jgi:hypothetical protein